MKLKGFAIAALALMGIPSCGKAHVEDPRVCRRWATAYTQDGQRFVCTFDGVHTLMCTGGSTLTWRYGSAADFVAEAQVPNRVLALNRSLQTGFTVVSSSTTFTEYRYDTSSRLLERRRSRRDFTGLRELDVIEYTAWDRLDRPISGTLRVGDRSQGITIRYNDSVRRMEASNGEAVTRDADGNVVMETVVIGFGAPSVVNYVIQSTAQFCL